MNFDVDYVFAGFYVISLMHCLWRWVCNFDLEKAFDRLPRKVEEWAVRVIQGMYSNAQSRARVNCQYSEEFGVGIGVHQGSVLSPLLIILGLEARSREFRTGVPWELLYADDLVLIAVTQEECIYKFKTWKADMESKGFVSSWRRHSSWCLVMATMASRNLARTPVLSAAVVSAATPSCANSLCCGSTGNTVV